ncbi:hypothetical protein ACXKGW_29425, partial [Klebsiella pneumoniae subsp. pneumoniae]
WHSTAVEVGGRWVFEVSARRGGRGALLREAAVLRAMIGAAEALSHAAATEEIAPEEARRELYEAIVAMVARSRR